MTQAQLAQGQDPLLAVRDVSVVFGGIIALNGVSFDMHQGQILGLIGPNGAGKTTLLEAVAALIPVDCGAVLWRGAASAPSHRRESIFYLPEGIRPWQEQYVARVLKFFAAVYRQPRVRIGEAVAAVGLDPVLRKQVFMLSKGYARRLMWALALLAPHPLLLMDEPFDGFDLKQTREMMTVLRRMAAAGRTVVLSTHQLVDAERVCDRFVLLAGGRIRAEGTLDELRARTSISTGLEDMFLALA